MSTSIRVIIFEVGEQKKTEARGLRFIAQLMLA
jgi:hypothetical protein